MEKKVWLFSLLLSLLTLNIHGQWTQCNGKYARNIINQFKVINDVLFAGSREGLISYNSSSDSWDKCYVDENVRVFTVFGDKIYFISGLHHVKTLSLSTLRIDSIPLHNIQSDQSTIQSIEIIHNSVYIATHQGLYFKSLNDSLWHLVNTLKGIRPPMGIKKIIEFQGKILCVTGNELFVSADGKTFNELINPTLKVNLKKYSPVANNSSITLNASVISDKLYICTMDGLLSTNDLINWNKVIEGSYIKDVIQLFCNGLIINGLGAAYSFDETSWTPFPINKQNDFVTTYSKLEVYHSKIFANIIGKGLTGIWRINFSINLKF